MDEPCPVLADEAGTVAISSDIALTFSETIQRGTGTLTLKTASGAVVETYDAATSVRLSFTGATVTVDPTAPLSGGTAYRLELAAGTVKDLAGNPYAGTTSYNFTTVIAREVADDYGASSATTGVLAVGGSASGRIETREDRDWFAVALSAGQVYSFTLASVAIDGLSDPFLPPYSSTATLRVANYAAATALERSFEVL